MGLLILLFTKIKYYIAPEVMCRTNHGVAADYFAVGIIGYECMIGKVVFQFIKI